jgi:CRISPR/Cas system endoribonuclease Cas6 (RAMP superfamily)
MRIFQQGAYISLDFLKKKSEVFTIHDQPLQDENFFELELNNKNKKYIQFTTSEPQDINAIKMELELFLASIKNNTPVPVSIHDGLRAMEVSQMIIEKIKKQLLLKEL